MIKMTLKDSLCQDATLGRRIPPQNLDVRQFTFIFVDVTFKLNPTFSFFFFV